MTKFTLSQTLLPSYAGIAQLALILEAQANFPELENQYRHY